MYAVIFEVHPQPGKLDAYLALAQELRPHLDEIDGFLSIERFASELRPGWALSVSFWQDEAALVRWRTFERHHQVQEVGRAHVFADYRIRVSQVVLDFDQGELTQPDRRSAYNDVTAHPSAFVALAEIEPGPQSEEVLRLVEAEIAVEHGSSVERFASIYTPGKHIVLSSWPDEGAAMAWQGGVAERLHGMQQGYRLRLTEVERDYGMFARHEAPQYYPPVAPSSEVAGG